MPGMDLFKQLHISHTETKVADQTCRLTKSQFTDTGPTSPSTDPITPSTCRQGSHQRTNFKETGMTQPGKSHTGKEGLNSKSSPFEADTFPLDHQGSETLSSQKNTEVSLGVNTKIPGKGHHRRPQPHR